MKNGFTLAEVLITLGIIAVIAAMTLPSIIGNYQKKKNVVVLQKAFSDIQRLFLDFRVETQCFGYLNDCFPNQNQFRDEFAKYLYTKRGFKDRFSKNTQIEVNVLGPKEKNTLILIMYYSMDTEGSNDKLLISPDGTYILGFRINQKDNTYQLKDNGKFFNPPNYTRAKIDIYTDPGKVNDFRGKWGKKVSKIGREIFYLYISSYGEFIPNGSTKCKGGVYNCGDISSNPSLCDPSNTSQNLNNGSYCFAKIIGDGWQMKY